jgi:hypothetical protein
MKWINVKDKLPESRTVILQVGDESYPAYLHKNGWFYEDKSEYGIRMAMARLDALKGSFIVSEVPEVMADAWCEIPNRNKGD